MFRVLEGKLREAQITREKLARLLGVSISTVSCKLNGKYPFTLPEACAIRRNLKETLNIDLTIEELFSTDQAS